MAASKSPAQSAKRLAQGAKHRALVRQGAAKSHLYLALSVRCELYTKLYRSSARYGVAVKHIGGVMYMSLTRALKVLLGIMLTCALWFYGGSAYSASMSCKVQGHWRDVAYLEPPMKQYESLKDCIAWTAYQFNLPEELLYSILYVERGPINGKCGTNRNGTQDCGPSQINDVRLGELRKFKLTKNDIKSKPCHNIWAMGYLIRREIEKADGNIWTGVGNYHYHYSVNQKVHDRYVNRIRRAWQTLVSSTYDYCIEEG